MSRTRIRLDGDHRVHDEDEIAAERERDVRVGDGTEAALDVVGPSMRTGANRNRRRGRRADGARDGHVLERAEPEERTRALIEIDGHDDELARHVAKRSGTPRRSIVSARKCSNASSVKMPAGASPRSGRARSRGLPRADGR